MDKIDSITVRMYNTGSVGDCLFLQFKKGEQVTFTMLIDCGGYNTTTAEITKCVADIKHTLGNNPIDLVVVTHEHLDHVSGFNQAKSLFDTIEFKQVWMAWTENPTDVIAKKLKKELGKKLKAVVAALSMHHENVTRRLRSRSMTSGLQRRLRRYASSLHSTLDAFHFESGMMPHKSLKSGLTVSSAMTYVKQKSKEKSKAKMFKKPGDVIQDLAGAEGLKFHILGPPRDEDLSGIRKKTQKDEMYSLQKHAALWNHQAFLGAVADSSDGNGVSDPPFNEKFVMSSVDEKEFFRTYNTREMSWRQIEEDWLDSSDALAIAVNTYTNNTSLVIAIEFESTGKVLLFPADAQSGNWISWHSDVVKQNLINNGGKDADELLLNTVFYKVGHHGSHNGTASKSGLDKMSKLKVAMMPVVQAKVPSQWGGSKNFPAKALYSELIRRTNGAVIRTDVGVVNDEDADTLREKNLSATMMKRLKASNKGLYQEWTVVD